MRAVPLRPASPNDPAHPSRRSAEVRPEPTDRDGSEDRTDRPAAGGLSQLLSPASRAWLVPVGLALLAAMLAGVLGSWLVLRQPDQYRSTTVVEMRRPDLFVEVNPGTITVLNQLRSKYAALIRTEPIVQPTAEALGLRPGVVRGALGAQVTADSLLFYPFATAATPEEARAIAQEATQRLVAYAEEEQAAAAVPGEEQIQLRIVQGAASASPIGTDGRRALIVGLAAAVLVGGCAYVGIEFRRAQRVRRAAGPDR